MSSREVRIDPYAKRAIAWLCAAHSHCHLICGTGEQKQVAVRVFDDEVSGTPGLLLQRLEERDVCQLELEEQLFDLIGGIYVMDADKSTSRSLSSGSITGLWRHLRLSRAPSRLTCA